VKTITFAHMKRLLRIETVQEMMYSLGIADVRHPLIELIGMERATRVREYDGVRLSLGFYMVVYKRSYCGSVLYGQTRYDYADGTVLFFAPGQTFNVNGMAETKPEGRILMFDPELLRGSAIDCPLRQYPFFAYTMNEALHVSEHERALLFRNLDSIDCELERGIDRHSHRLYASALAMLLDHCLRFYDRQFATRQPLATDIVARFERLLIDYFAEGNLINRGLPTIGYLADKLCLSPNYLDDLIKNATGRSAKDMVNQHVMDEAKRRLASSRLPINEIAWSLGFEYPQYFSQMFKQRVGVTPGQYRQTMQMQ